MTAVARLEAFEFARDAPGGATEPAVMRCHSDDGIVEAVVKFTWQECTAQALTRELIGCLLARALGMPAAIPALVDVPEEFPDALAPIRPQLAARIRNSVTPAFGSVHLGPSFVLCRDSDGGIPVLRPFALEIWAFDQLTMNPDRNSVKPNCLSNGEQIAVFDHEKALNCYGVGGLVPAPWEARWEPYAGHLFHATVTSEGGNLDRLQAAWATISACEVVDTMLGRVPASWNSAEVSKEIRAYLLALGANSELAFDNLRKCLP